MLKKTAVFLTTLGLASFSCLPHASAAGEVYLPNLGATATGTVFGLKRGLDVNVVQPAPEGATAAPGGLPPALDKVAGGLGPDGFIHTLATDNLGNLQTGRTWTLGVVTDSVSAAQSGAWTTGRTWTLGSVADSVSAVQSGFWDIRNITGIISLPTGASSASNQATQITSLSSIDGKLTGVASSANQSTEITSLSSIDTKLTSQATAANQSTGNASLSSIDGKLTNVSTSTLQTAGNGSLSSIDTKLSSQATAANQATTNASLSSIDTKLTSQATAANQATQITQLGTLATETTASAINAKLANDFGANAGAVRTAAQLGNSTGTADFGSGTTSSQTLRVVLPTDQAPVQVKAPVNSTGSGASGTVSTVTTVTAPANATGFILQNLDTSNTNIRWAIGRVATPTVGQQLQPGRDSGFVPSGASISIVSESGTNDFDLQWVSQ